MMQMLLFQPFPAVQIKVDERMQQPENLNSAQAHEIILSNGETSWPETLCPAFQGAASLEPQIPPQLDNTGFNPWRDACSEMM